MRLNTILMTAALMGVAALPAAAQSPQQRLNEEHAEWHQKHDRDAYRNPANYQREHAELHQRINQQYARMQRQYGYNPNYGYPQGGYYPQQNPGGYYPYGPPRQIPGGWYDQNGRYHPYTQGQSGWYNNGQRQNGYYDQNGNWHPYNNGQRQNGYYDQYGNWHPYNGDYGYQRGDDDDGGRGHNPKAEGRHDNGKHKGWYKNGHDRDDDD